MSETLVIPKLRIVINILNKHTTVSWNKTQPDSLQEINPLCWQAIKGSNFIILEDFLWD